MNSFLSFAVAACCGIYARFMSCKKAEAYFGKVHFNANHGGDLCVAFMVWLSGKSGGLTEYLVPDGTTYCAARLDA